MPTYDNYLRECRLRVEPLLKDDEYFLLSYCRDEIHAFLHMPSIGQTWEKIPTNQNNIHEGIDYVIRRIINLINKTHSEN